MREMANFIWLNPKAQCMRRLLLFTAIYIRFGAALGQSNWEKGRDSLIRALSGSREDSNAAMTMIYLGAQYEYNRQDSAFYYFRRAYELSKRVNYVRGMVNGLSLQAGLLADQDKLTEAIALDSEAIAIAAKARYRKGLAGVYNNIAIAYDRRGDDVTSIDYYLKAIAIDQEVRDNYNLSTGYSNIAGIYNNLKEYGKGYSYSLEGILLGRQVGNPSAVESGYINLGSALIRLKRPDTALVVLYDARRVARDNKDYDIADQALNDICAIYQQGRQLPMLKASATEMLNFARSVNERQGVFFGLEELYFYYLLSKDYRQAMVYCRQLIALARQEKVNKDLDDAYHDAATLELAQGHLDDYFRYNDLKDSIDGLLLSDKVLKNTQELETRFSLHEKQTEIDDLQEKSRIRELVVRQQHLMNAVLGGLVAVVILVAFLYRRNYRQKKRLLLTDGMLKEQRIIELEKEKQLLGAAAVLRGQVEERSRLAKDLHDGVGSILSGVKYSFINMKENLIITPDAAAAFELGMGLLDRSIRELRRVAHNMMPEALIKFGLDTALRDFCDSIDQSGAVSLTYSSYDLHETSIPGTQAIAIYHIVLELVNNVLRHAGAKTALVQLVRKEEALSITVEDDGKGFDPAILRGSEGIGYLNLKNRIAWLNGTIDIQTDPGKGTSVNIELPNIAA
jgi:two-component system NarL family sensor kinase